MEHGEKNNRKKIFAWAGALLAIAGGLAFLWLLQRLVMPKYMHGVTEGALIAEYYQEKVPHDVIFLGDCEVYENYSTVTLWEEYGISSYIRGSAQQLVWQSYYLLKDTIRTEKPAAVVFNVLALSYDEPQNEAYNRMTLDGMRFSADKFLAVRASMTGREKEIDYLFPILRFHSRITKLEQDDLTYLFRRDPVSCNGFVVQTGVLPAGDLPAGQILGDYTFGARAMDHLDRMRALCEENGMELILVKAPSVWPYWYPEWDAQVRDYASAHGLAYYNFLEDADAIGIDLRTDTYDGGLHLNLNGAEKMSRWFGRILKEEHNIPSRRGEAAEEAAWEAVAERYERWKNGS